MPPSFNPDELLRLDNQLCFALYTSSRLMTRAYAPLLAPFDLTYPQYIALLVLWERDELPVSELGQRLYLDSGTLTPLLKRLEAKGLIRRQRTTHDERIVHISLTPQGHALKSQIISVPLNLLQDDSVNIQQLTQLKNQLETLIDTLHSQQSKN